MTTGNTQFKVENGLYVTGIANLESNLWVGGSANVVGDLTVGGSVVFTANITGNFVPDVSGRALGSNTKRWEMWANSLSVANTATFFGNTVPNANGINLGVDASRWYVYATDLNTSNSISVANVATVSNTLNVTNRINISSNVMFQANTLVYANAVMGSVNVDSYSATTYRTSKYLIEAKSYNGGYQITELLATHDGTTAFVSEYGIVNTVATFCTYDATLSGGNLVLSVTPTVNTTFKLSRTTLTS